MECHVVALICLTLKGLKIEPMLIANKAFAILFNPLVTERCSDYLFNLNPWDWVDFRCKSSSEEVFN